MNLGSSSSLLMHLHAQSQSFDESVAIPPASAFAAAPPVPPWGRHNSVCVEDLLPAVDTFQHNPEICVTNSSGDLVSIPAVGGHGHLGLARHHGLGVGGLAVVPPATTATAAAALVAAGAAAAGAAGAAGLVSTGGQAANYGCERMDESF